MWPGELHGTFWVWVWGSPALCSRPSILGHFLPFCALFPQVQVLESGTDVIPLGILQMLTLRLTAVVRNDSPKVTVSWVVGWEAATWLCFQQLTPSPDWR